MSGIRLKYVHQWVDKRQGGAKARYYFRRPGFKHDCRCRDCPVARNSWTPIKRACQSVAETIGAGRTKAGSIGALIVSYFGSPSFLALATGTQHNYRLILEKFRSEHGDKPVALLNRQHINAMLAQKVDDPGGRKPLASVAKALMHSPSRKVGARTIRPSASNRSKIERRFPLLDEDEIAQFENCHPIGSRARLALALLLYTAQRRSDVIRMGRQHVRDGVVHVRQQKTGRCWRSHCTLPSRPSSRRHRANTCPS